MKQIQREFEGNNFMAIERDGEPWFVAKDVCSILELTDTSKTVRTVCSEAGTNTIRIRSNGQRRYVLCINEPNLYRLIFKSRKPFAEKFQDWIVEEVLPEIRKTGKYSVQHKKVREDSKRVRSHFTEILKDHGYEKKHHFIQTSKQMRKAHGITAKKDDMSELELAKILASESLSILRIVQDNAEGYYECNPLCIESCNQVEDLTEQKKKLA